MPMSPPPGPATCLPNRDWIAAHIPHQGDMCLLDAVEQWDETDIVCRASSHNGPENPLRSQQGLGICLGIEYAAQAMAVHGALLAGTDRAPGSGYLASVRSVEWAQPQLSTAGEDLHIRAQRISGNKDSFLYAFSIHAGTRQLLSGRASVLQTTASANPTF